MLEGLPLLASVIGPQQKRFADFMRRCRSGDRSVVEGEFTLRTNNGTRHAHILCRPPSPGSPMSTEYFMSLVDVTDQRHLEQERARAAREHAALASRLITIQDDERRRIARNLHDDIGQQVTALRLKLEAAGLAGTDAERLEAIARLQEMIEALDRRLHFVATELRPATLDLGIAAALDQFVQEWSLNFGIPAQFQATNLAHTDLTPETETHVYRVVQEALNNISKHAGAGRVAVLLERRDDGVVVVVEDDGLGFDLDAARDREEGVGLVNMRERAQLIGGELEIETTPGHGTSLFLRFPFPPLRPAGHEGETHAIGVSHWSGNRSGTGPQS
jgi:signal transduction histidine kinase